MYVINDSITSKFEGMTNRELGSYVRSKLKEVGITSRMVSVRVSDCGYSTSVDCYVKDLSVDINAVKKIVSEVDYIRYDPYAQEILSGCNIFTHVEYDWEIMRDAKNAVRESVKAEMAKINDNKNHDLYVDDDGKKVCLCVSKNEDRQGHVWFTYYIGKLNEAPMCRFNTWDALVEHMVVVRAVERAKRKEA